MKKKRRVLFFALVIAASFGAQTAHATVRYALIVGNNHGNTEDGTHLPDLLHAEDEAFRVRDKLIQYANFSKKNISVLTGKRRKEIIVEAEKLAALHRRDKETLEDVPTLFMLFFTGHGLNGELLTADEPLTGTDLGAIFKAFSATFTVGVFDACFSGSLNLKRLRAKGIHVLHGVNVLEQLPRELLNSAGTMWFTSSQPDQISYEDVKLGGVFTHFFLEGMEKADRTGFGITIESVWEYARSRTQSYTGSLGRPQTPQKMVRDLTSTGPVFLTFPAKRDATLVFEPDVSGRFILRYKDDLLVEVIDKVAGQKMKVPVYATDITMVQVDAKGATRQLFSVMPGNEIRVSNRVGWRRYKGMGRQEETLRSKGEQLEHLVLSEPVNKATGLLDVGYSAAIKNTHSAVPINNVAAGLRIYYGNLFARPHAQFGRRSESFPAWGYAVNRIDVGLQIGPTFEAKRIQLSGFADTRWIHQAIDYRDGKERTADGLSLGGGMSLVLVIVYNPLHLIGVLEAGVRRDWSPVARIDSDPVWQTVPWVNAGVGVELF